MSDRSRPLKSPYRCLHCNKQFNRSEHLARHILGHSKDRPFACSICDKRFARGDILKRHQAAHQPDDAEKASRIASSTFRACSPCASARVKCSGSDVCERCTKKGIECHYPLDRKRTRKRDHPLHDHEQSIERQHRLRSSAAVKSCANDAGALGNNTATSVLSVRGTVSVDNSDGVEAHSLTLGQQYSGETHPVGPTSPIQEVTMKEISSGGMNAGEVISSWRGMRSQQSLGSGWIPSLYPDQGRTAAYDFTLPANESAGFSTINWLPLSNLDHEQWDLGSLNFGDYPSIALESFLAQPTSYGQDLEYLDESNSQQGIITDQTTPGRIARAVSTDSHKAQTEYDSLPTPRSHSNDSTGSPSASSTYYIDGAGGRGPRYGKLGRQSSTAGHGIGRPLKFSDRPQDIAFAFPVMAETQIPQLREILHNNISQELHHRLIDEFNQTCSYFISDYFPSLEIISLSIHLYFEHFHPTFPLIHRASFALQPSAWLLALATSAIGVLYLGTDDSRQCSDAFLELIRAVLERDDFLDKLTYDRDLPLDYATEDIMKVQALILSMVTMSHGCRDSLVRHAYTARSQLVALCLHSGMLRDKPYQNTEETPPAESIWLQWIHNESRRRAGYFIWLLDCMMAYESDSRPQMNLDDAEALLPCREGVWDAADEIEWQQAQNSYNVSQSLLEAVEILYKEMKINPSIGEFGRILLIHGLYRRTWEVAMYHKHNLSNWTPSAQKTEQPSEKLIHLGTWLPANPIFSKWRNSACDCLDILHWSANSNVALNEGVEHPTILHLHLARLILLAPVVTLRNIASSIVRSSRRLDSRGVPLDTLDNKERFEMMGWVDQDQHKARLSLVHAGAIFWHVRRFSCDSIMEPFAVYLASLVVWGYATFSRLKGQRHLTQDNVQSNSSSRQPLSKRSLNYSGTESNRSESHSSTGPANQLLPRVGSSTIYPMDSSHSSSSQLSEHAEALEPDLAFIQLDRPCDDELVQTFVLRGNQMTGYMSRIGDICGIDGPQKVLREGAYFLTSSGTHVRSSKASDDAIHGMRPTWGVAEKHAAFLERLANLIKLNGS